MATRTVTALILHPNGAPWRGAEVRFRPTRETFTLTPDETFPLDTVIAVTGGDGVLEATLVSGLDVAYVVTMPDDESFPIVVSDGGPVTLEVLRASYAGDPEALDNIQTVVEALLADPDVVANISHEDIGDIGIASHPTIDAALNTAAAHQARTDNPHAVTKAHVGLSAVDNTSDATKPVSTAQAAAVATKQDASANLTALAAIARAQGDLIVGGASGWTRLPKGAAGQVVRMNAGATDPEWGAGGGSSGALALIASQPFSGVAAMNLDGVFSATYETYLVLLNGLAQSSNQHITFRLRAGGVDAAGADYGWSMNETNAAGANGPAAGSAVTSGRILAALSNAITAGVYDLTISRPFVVSSTTVLVNGAVRATGTGGSRFSGQVAHQVVASYDGFSIAPAAGTLTGGVRVYGFAN